MCESPLSFHFCNWGADLSIVGISAKTQIVNGGFIFPILTRQVSAFQFFQHSETLKIE